MPEVLLLFEGIDKWRSAQEAEDDSDNIRSTRQKPHRHKELHRQAGTIA
jgi:hypothetical protein